MREGGWWCGSKDLAGSCHGRGGRPPASGASPQMCGRGCTGVRQGRMEGGRCMTQQVQGGAGGRRVYGAVREAGAAAGGGSGAAVTMAAAAAAGPPVRRPACEGPGQCRHAVCTPTTFPPPYLPGPRTAANVLRCPHLPTSTTCSSHCLQTPRLTAAMPPMTGGPGPRPPNH